jgi:transcriptional regulator with XRE-family HTH domain
MEFGDPESPKVSLARRFENFILSTLTTESTGISEVRPRDVVRCHRCHLVQYRTLSDLCRRCEQALPEPPRPDLASNGAFNNNAEGTIHSNHFPADQEGQQERIHSRTRTARELTIGRKLRELRDQRHLTQQEMASKAGVPRTYISRIENARLLPGPVMLRRIADALQVEILDLLPPSKNGGILSNLSSQSNGNTVSESSAPEDVFWTCLSQYFVQLELQQMSVLLEHVRAWAEQNLNRAFAPESSMVAR